MPEVSILGDEVPDTGVFLDLIGNQITAAAAPSIGQIQAWVLADGGANEGLRGSFRIPADAGTISAPTLVVRGILDGAPGASDVLSFGFRKRAVAPNEVADGTFDAEQAGSVTIGSSGQNYADEDEVEVTITLTAADYAAGDTVYYYLYLHAANTTYAGNVLLTQVVFRWS